MRLLVVVDARTNIQIYKSVGIDMQDNGLPQPCRLLGEWVTLIFRSWFCGILCRLILAV